MKLTFWNLVVIVWKNFICCDIKGLKRNWEFCGAFGLEGFEVIED